MVKNDVPIRLQVPTQPIESVYEISKGGKTIKLRTRDGVHIAPEGNKILAKTVLPYLESILQITAQPKGYTPPLKNTQGQ